MHPIPLCGNYAQVDRPTASGIDATLMSHQAAPIAEAMLSKKLHPNPSQVRTLMYLDPIDPSHFIQPHGYLFDDGISR